MLFKKRTTKQEAGSRKQEIRNELSREDAKTRRFKDLIIRSFAASREKGNSSAINIKNLLFGILSFGSFSLLTVFLLMVSAGSSFAAQQYQGLCAVVKIEILQELTLERIGFLATLQITNNEADASITSFAAQLTFENPALSNAGSPNDASNLFFVQTPKISGVNAVDGTGIIPPGQTAKVQWFIIPKISAGGESAEGVRYLVGAQLSGAIYGQEIAPEVLVVLPATITVKPEPQLEITYFQPRDVDGDDPFTPDLVESPIPFTLGVLVRNVGFGRAKSIKIKSEQPRIVENKQGLLMIAQLLGARVDDQPTNQASLTIDLGNIEPSKCRKGAWDMITSLSGEFIEFKASYTHASELGGRETSVIKSLNAFFIVHEVLNDQPGRDSMLDFLAETGTNNDLIPDFLYESDCNILPVNHVQDVGLIESQGLTSRIRAYSNFENWVFFRLDDPAQAKYQIASVVRSDGKALSPRNYWTNIRYHKPDNAKQTFLNIFDFVAPGEYQYVVTYQPTAQDLDAPVTTLRFAGPVKEVSGKFYVTPDTQLYFTAVDASPVGTYYRMDQTGDFLPAYPFTISTTGEHVVEYYSQDAPGNNEAVQSARVELASGYPVMTDLQTDTSEIFNVGNSLSIRPTAVNVTFDSTNVPAGLQARLEVFRGVFAYPTVSQVPSSPTPINTATLLVGGENVDYYRYKVNEGAWSAEIPIGSPIVLAQLPTGLVKLFVNSRSKYGTYLPDADILQVTWVVDPAAPGIGITGLAETPTRSITANLLVSGADNYCYRLDNSFYRPNSSDGSSIALTDLTEGNHVLEVVGRTSAAEACPGNVSGIALSWTVNRGYGHDLSAATRILDRQIADVSANPAIISWDGRDANGVVAPPGWYTMKVTISDALGRTTTAIRLVKVGNVLPDGALLSNAGQANQTEAQAYGKWVVWQDQRSGSWNIWAQNLSGNAVPPTAITNSINNQERPRTDGRLVVWQSRQADGTWDIWGKELDSAEPSFPVTSTPDLDEIKPVVYWPWIVYQAKPVGQPNSPWQLFAFNMIDQSTVAVDPTGYDQLDPALHRQHLVWQDWRDLGPGEIYLKNLHSGVSRRITDNPAGQYHPVIFDRWIVWEDNRNTQVDLYGYNLLREAEVQLTDTPEDEVSPSINGKWVVFGEDAAGETRLNLRLLHLDNLMAVQLTNTPSAKANIHLASGKLIWVDDINGPRQVIMGNNPVLQPVFNNNNMIAITDQMAAQIGDAYTLLNLWHGLAEVMEINHYAAFLPQPIAETARWESGVPAGVNFALQPGSFVWVKFETAKVLDLGSKSCTPLNLTTGVNVFSFACFPDHYSAWQLIRELGVANINALRILDPGTGQWQTTFINGSKLTGDDFSIPNVAVLLVDMVSPINSWKPGE